VLLLEQLDALQGLMQRSVLRCADREAQNVDRLAARLGRPSGHTSRQILRLSGLSQRLEFGLRTQAQAVRNRLERSSLALPRAAQLALRDPREALERLGQRLHAVDPQRILQRGYAWVVQEDGLPVTSALQAQAGQQWTATLADGTVDLRVLQAHPD
jgi:exodeoxyribonuclease VII large subunit